MGGGVGISIFGEYRIASEKTMFAMPETSIGLFPDVGSSAWLPHIGHGLGEYVALTGVRLKAGDLLELGIATHFLPSIKMEELETRVIEGAVRGNPEKSRAAINALLAELGSAGLSGADPSVSVFGSDRAAGRGRIAACFDNKASLENIISSLEILRASGGEADQAWAEQTLLSLSLCSPTSLKVTLAQLQRGRTMDLKACLEMEYRISQGCMRHPDFREGVRALLVDKDKNPKWTPGALADVSQELIDDHFRPLAVRELVLESCDRGLMGGSRRTIHTKF
jgi:enoyl-CoA hydratase/carnithine racemase